MEKNPKYIQVEHHIKRAIKNKSIVNKLPGERILAKELGYSYMTIRKAVENLVNQGVLFKIATKGTFVSDINTSHSKKTLTIGYFLDSSIASGISSPYYSLIFHALEKEATKHNYSIVYFSDISHNKLHQVLGKLDGVIATCFPRIEDTIQDIKEKVPVVVLDNSSADKSIPSVIIDNFNADVESVNYICSLAHQRIGFICGLSDSDIGNNRFAGYLKGLKKHNIEFDQSLVFRGNYSYDAGMEGASYFLQLKQPPSAIICANDSMAIGAMRKLHQEGIRVPEDISVIGFDDIEVASQVTPPLTTVAAPISDIAAHSFHLLKEMIQGQTPDNKHIALPAHLVIRQSCRAIKATTPVTPV